MEKEKKQGRLIATCEIILSASIITGFFLPWLQTSGFGENLMQHSSIPKLINVITSMAQNVNLLGSTMNNQIYLIYFLYLPPALAAGNIIMRFIAPRTYKALPLYISSLVLLETIVFIWVWQEKFNGIGSMGTGAIVTLLSGLILWVITIVDIIRHYREDQLLIKIHLIIPMSLAAIVIINDIYTTNAVISPTKGHNIKNIIFNQLEQNTHSPFGLIPLILILLLFGVALFLFWRALKKTPRKTSKTHATRGNQETIPTTNAKKLVETTENTSHKQNLPAEQTGECVNPTHYIQKNNSTTTSDEPKN